MKYILLACLLWQFPLAADEERNFRTAVRALEREGPSIALSTALNRLAFLYFERMEYKRAEEVSRRALAVERALPEMRRSEIAIGLNNIAAALSGQRRHAEAAKYVRETLTVFTLADAPRVFALNTLGVIELYRRRYRQAAECFREAADRWTATLGANDIHVAEALANLASVYTKSGKSEEAIDLWKHVFEITEPQLASGAPMRGVLLRGYADTLARAGRKQESNRIREQSRAFTEAGAGPNGRTVDAGDLLAVRSLK